MPAMDAVLMTTPRRPSASTGSVRAMAAAPIRIRLNVPIRLTSMTLRNDARSCGDPSRPTVRDAQPTPAQFTTVRSGTPCPAAACTAAATDPSSDTSVFTNRPPDSAATVFPCSSFRSAMTTVAPVAASARATASPRPLAAPEMIAAVPFSLMGGAYFGPAGLTEPGSVTGRTDGPHILSVPTISIDVGVRLAGRNSHAPPGARGTAGWQGDLGEDFPGKSVGGAHGRLARVLHDPAGPDDREHRDPQHDHEAARVARRCPVGHQCVR